MFNNKLSMLSNKQSIFDTIIQFFKEDDWHFEKIEGKPMLKMGFKGTNSSFRLFAQADEENCRAIFYSILDSNIPPEKHATVAEFLTRANYGLKMGNFELDFSDGEVRYKTSIDVEGGQLVSTMVKNLVYANVLMMDKYYPGIMSVVYGGASPVDAIAKIEG